jgi:hypothetical protein
MNSRAPLPTPAELITKALADPTRDGVELLKAIAIYADPIQVLATAYELDKIQSVNEMLHDNLDRGAQFEIVKGT